MTVLISDSYARFLRVENPDRGYLPLHRTASPRPDQVVQFWNNKILVMTVQVVAVRGQRPPTIEWRKIKS